MRNGYRWATVDSYFFVNLLHKTERLLYNRPMVLNRGLEMYKRLDHVLEVEMGVGVYVEFNETDCGGSWWEYVVLRDGEEIQRSANEYGNPAAAARDGLSWYLGDL